MPRPDGDTGSRGVKVHPNSLLETVIKEDRRLARMMQYGEQAFEEDRRQMEQWYRNGCVSVPGSTIREV